MSIPVSRDALRFVRAEDPIDQRTIDAARLVVVDYGRDRFIVIEIRFAVADVSGTWDDLAKRHGSTKKPQKPVQRDASVKEPRVARGEDGTLFVLVPGEQSMRPRQGRPESSVFETKSVVLAGGGSGPDDSDSVSYSGDKPFWVELPASAAPAASSIAVPVPKMAAPELPAESVATTFNADFEDHDREQPLQVHEPYVLAFYAGKPDPHASASVAGTVMFDPGERDARLTIQITTGDFTIEQPSQDLLVKRDGTSRGRARFDVTPIREGPGTLAATILKDGNFVQKIELTVNVGGSGQTIENITTSGRSFTADESIKPRDLVLLVEQTPAGGIEIIAAQQGRDPLRGRSDMTAAGLADLITGLRATLKTLIEEKFDDDAHHVAYTDAIEIAPAIHEETLAALAEESFAIFRSIFFESGADDRMKDIGRLLASLSAGPSRDIQIVTTRFVIPWQLLYAALSVEPVESKNFLGFSHRIEHLALKSGWDIQQAEIPNTGKLRISVNVNRGIDAELGLTAVQEQLQFFDELSASRDVKVEVRDTVAGVKKALADPQLADQVIYFYCHAVSNAAGEGVGKSALLFEGKKPLTLNTLRAAGKIDALPYSGAPLVFINACQSAELSPLFYDGFVPHLTSRGARGVIGTECDTPALFGAKWGQAFFREFLDGGELGEVMLTLRRKFLEEQHNLLGLLYAVHCNGNTRVDPAVGLTAS